MGLKRFYHQVGIEAGCDEAGRGCLAGPVFAAAVIFPHEIDIPLLNDSKQLTNKQRYTLRDKIKQKSLSFAVAQVNNAEIDEINIYKASMLAMHRAIDKLSKTPAHLLIDGKLFIPHKKIPYTCVVKGDSKFYSIAAASVLAKTYRDDYMVRLHEEYAYYQWNKNKGYPTKAHREAIREHGISPYHRKSFRLLPDATQMTLKGL